MAKGLFPSSVDKERKKGTRTSLQGLYQGVCLCTSQGKIPTRDVLAVVVAQRVAIFLLGDFWQWYDKQIYVQAPITTVTWIPGWGGGGEGRRGEGWHGEHRDLFNRDMLRIERLGKWIITVVILLLLVIDKGRKKGRVTDKIDCLTFLCKCVCVWCFRLSSHPFLHE